MKMTEKQNKRKAVTDPELPHKKQKKNVKPVKAKVSEKSNKHGQPPKGKFEKKGKKTFNKTSDPKGKGMTTEKPEDMDWKEFRKQRKELKEKRKAADESYDIILEANRVCEKLRRKKLEGGKEERQKLVETLHKNILQKKAYSKFILKHDASRVIQCLLKYSNEKIRREISKEIIPFIIQMIQSKYGRHCIKRMLKLGNTETRAEIIKAFYGHVVKLTSHSTSAPIFEFAYSFASPLNKRHLVQEYFGDMFKRTKEDRIQHLKDVYEKSPEMKAAALGATKANLLKVLNKSLLDSALVHTVLYQFLTECSSEDRAELIPQLSEHAVVLSNSKDGAKTVLYCIWNGTNKDKKAIIRAMKDYIIDLSRHEHGHVSVIGVLDAADDTVLINKAILTPILEHVYDIASDDWGKKVILWLVAPGDSAYFHPSFVKELEDGRKNSTSKKTPEARRTEILNYSIGKLLGNVTSTPKIWLITAPLTTLAILKAGSGEALKKAYESIIRVLMDENWKIKEDDEEYVPVEHSALHMVFKKLMLYEKDLNQSRGTSFAEVLVNNLNSDVVKHWIKTSRGCFLLVFVFENGTEETRSSLFNILKPDINLIKKESSKGAKILLKKLKDV